MYGGMIAPTSIGKDEGKKNNMYDSKTKAILAALGVDEDDEDRAWRAVKRRFGERKVSRRKLISFLGRRDFDYQTMTRIVSKLEGHAAE